jgi:hypothetical protein
MIIFHKFLIGTAILFCAGFSAWTFAGGGGSGATTNSVLGSAFLFGAVALSYYLKNLKRFLGK